MRGAPPARCGHEIDASVASTRVAAHGWARMFAKICRTIQNHAPPLFACHLSGERMKTTYAAILALALPVTLVAQQPSGAPTANPITTAFRGRITNFHR